MGDDAVRRELQKTDDAIRAAIGTRPTLMRPPYGSITARQKKWIHQEFGYRIILWDVDPLDWKRPGPSVVTHRIVSETRPGSIILSHDIHPRHDQGDAGDLRSVAGEGIQVRHRLRVDRDGNGRRTPKPSPQRRGPLTRRPPPPCRAAPNE